MNTKIKVLIASINDWINVIKINSVSERRINNIVLELIKNHSADFLIENISLSSNGGNQPPKKINAFNNAIKIILEYSPKKNNANVKPEYSTL